MKFTYTLWSPQNKVEYYEEKDIPVIVGIPPALMYHQTFFCTKCGMIWARIECEAGTEFETNRSLCFRHQNLLNDYHVPGSLLWWGSQEKAPISRFVARELANLPDALVKREFNLHLKHYGDRYGY